MYKRFFTHFFKILFLENTRLDLNFNSVFLHQPSPKQPVLRESSRWNAAKVIGRSGVDLGNDCHFFMSFEIRFKIKLQNSSPNSWNRASIFLS